MGKATAKKIAGDAKDIPDGMFHRGHGGARKRKVRARKRRLEKRIRRAGKKACWCP